MYVFLQRSICVLAFILITDEKERLDFLIFLVTIEFDNKVRILFSGPEDKLPNPRDLICGF